MKADQQYSTSFSGSIFKSSIAHKHSSHTERHTHHGHHHSSGIDLSREDKLLSNGHGTEGKIASSSHSGLRSKNIDNHSTVTVSFGKTGTEENDTDPIGSSGTTSDESPINAHRSLEHITSISTHPAHSHSHSHPQPHSHHQLPLQPAHVHETHGLHATSHPTHSGNTHHNQHSALTTHNINSSSQPFNGHLSYHSSQNNGHHGHLVSHHGHGHHSITPTAHHHGHSVGHSHSHGHSHNHSHGHSHGNGHTSFGSINESASASLKHTSSSASNSTHSGLHNNENHSHQHSNSSHHNHHSSSSHSSSHHNHHSHNSHHGHHGSHHSHHQRNHNIAHYLHGSSNYQSVGGEPSNQERDLLTSPSSSSSNHFSIAFRGLSHLTSSHGSGGAGLDSSSHHNHHHQTSVSPSLTSPSGSSALGLSKVNFHYDDQSGSPPSLSSNQTIWNTMVDTSATTHVLSNEDQKDLDGDDGDGTGSETGNSPGLKHPLYDDNSASALDSPTPSLVIPNLKKAKRQPQPIPDNCKDEAYWERRRRNNESAKRSRESRRLKEHQTHLKVKMLEHDNMRLLAKVSILENEVEKLRKIAYDRRDGSSSGSSSSTSANDGSRERASSSNGPKSKDSRVPS